MVDPTNVYGGLLPGARGMTPTQRAFVEAAEALGATEPADARPLTELPRLSSRELDDLVDLGVVREASDWRYYVFRPRRGDAVGVVQPTAPPRPVRWGRRRYLVAFLFWLVVVLVPVLLLQLTAR